MLRKVFCNIVLTALIINMFILISNIKPAKTAILVVPDDYPTIQEAVNAANSGDIIFVRAGTYLENIIVNKKISLIGEERGNTIIDGGGFGVAVKITMDCVRMTGFTVRNHKTYDGVQLKRVRNCSISGNILADNYFGIWLEMSSYNYISENIIVNNRDGIVLYRSSQNILHKNNITDNLIGIYIYSSSTYNTLIENELRANQAGISLGASSNYNNISRNVVISCSNGIELDSALNNNIYRNNVTANSWVGIGFTNAQRNEVYENILQNNFYGISFEDSSYNSLRRNRIERSWHGVWIGDSYYNDINQNLIENNQYGIELSYSVNNIISENNVTSNQYAIYLLDYSHDNKFYHNNLINNTHQAHDISKSYNVWDNGYPSGGNYWSDYVGVDEKNGPNQDQLGSDGIGDTPYIIDRFNVDRYPLIKPFRSSTCLTVVVYDWDGVGAALKGGDTWVELIRHGEVSGVTQHVDDYSRAVFYDVEPGTYYVNVWHRPTESVSWREFWAQKTNIVVEAGKTTNVEVRRHYPIITGFEVQRVPAKTGEPATITVTIKNIDSNVQWVKANIIIKHESGEWVYQNGSKSQKLQPEQETTFTFSNFTPEKEGAYYGLVMCSIVGGGEQVTDLEGWIKLFTVGLLQPPKEVRLNVPYQSQDETGWCGITSLAMVLRYYGYYYHSWDVADDLDLPTDRGVNLKQLYDYVRERFPRLTAELGIYSEKTLKLLDDVRSNLVRGYPVIAALKLDVGRHGIVVVGYNDTGFFIHDPDRVLRSKESLQLYISNEKLYEILEAPNIYGTLLVLKGEIPTKYVFTGSLSLSRRTINFEGGKQIQLSDIYMVDLQNGDFHYLDLDRGLTWKVNGVESGIDMWDELRVYINVANNMDYSQRFKVRLIILGEDGKVYYEKEEITEEIPEYYFRFHQTNVPPWHFPLYNLPKTQNYRVVLELYNQTDFKVDTFYTPYFHYTANYKCIVNVENQNFHVTIDSNSIISNFIFSKDDKKLAITVEGDEGTMGYLNLTVPTSLLGGPYTITIDGNTLIEDYEAPTNGTHTFIYFTYTHSKHLIEITGTTVIPEFPSILILLLLMTLAIITVILLKSKLITIIS